MREMIGSVLIYLAALTTAQGGPLHEGAKNGDLAAIAAALDAGAAIEEQDKGATPLFLAVRSHHPEAAVIKRGAGVSKQSALGLPITVAILKGYADLMQLLTFEAHPMKLTG
ncbi:hypothetical protein EN745_08690 [Mesorhizobium sp. M4A.F.Ca.ET.022.05.2.1]|uniref:ankyrin repeat domain-containing protein n=1 Tax=Mesorhizobium sp. M4A.F.Ca.ET.022.05.2.1 TaxID=2496653 RepID=UPI000FCAAA59|nr:ankyrin repeat domain-containing protein [Mesorhizobium sp. M4A.F.Ca.ET.022.05.2.1]RVC81786.1 hypothetical protein EN745_08690 [Mesorhizobium sp. M4A.F.Ca.ET.022.05.2.1]